MWRARCKEGRRKGRGHKKVKLLEQPLGKWERRGGLVFAHDDLRLIVWLSPILGLDEHPAAQK